MSILTERNGSAYLEFDRAVAEVESILAFAKVLEVASGEDDAAQVLHVLSRRTRLLAEAFEHERCRYRESVIRDELDKKTIAEHGGAVATILPEVWEKNAKEARERAKAEEP